MPELTSDVAVSGFIGLTVVFARRNEMTPAKLKPPPARENIIAAEMRVNRGISSKGAIKEIPHMVAATNAATAGGGILSSSDFM